MTIQEQVKQSYEKLKNKKRASEIYGCTDFYFKGSIVGGKAKDEDVYHSALQAIRQAASEHKETAKQVLHDIDVICEIVTGK